MQDWPTNAFYSDTVPWFFVQGIDGTNMVEVNVYTFCWLGVLLGPISLISPDRALSAYVTMLAIARVGLDGFRDGTDLARAFPDTAKSARELIAAINEILPPVGEEIPGLLSPVAPWRIEQLKVLSNGFVATLRTEAERSFVLKVEDQRYLSSYNLVKKMEDCFPPECWQVINDEAKREFMECGKCLALERYTGAGFHALRGVECVIRQYIVKLTTTLPHKRDWWTYIDVLRKNGADAKLIAVLENIRSLNRNPLMHPEDWLDIDDAMGIFAICNTAIIRLVAGIK